MESNENSIQDIELEYYLFMIINHEFLSGRTENELHIFRNLCTDSQPSLIYKRKFVDKKREILLAYGQVFSCDLFPSGCIYIGIETRSGAMVFQDHLGYLNRASDLIDIKPLQIFTPDKIIQKRIEIPPEVKKSVLELDGIRREYELALSNTIFLTFSKGTKMNEKDKKETIKKVLDAHFL